MFRKSLKHSKRALRVLLGFVVVLLNGGLATRGLAEPADLKRGLPNFSLEDQFGASIASYALEGRPVIVIGSDRGGWDSSRDWSRAIAELLDSREGESLDTAIVQVADLRTVPRFLRPTVGQQIRRRVETSLLLDWQGEIAGPFNFKPEKANVVMLRRDGSVVAHIVSNLPKAEELEEVREALADLEVTEDEAPTAWLRGVLLGPNL